jgi:hypothetical protein
MIRQGLCVQRPWQVHLEVREFELFEICFFKISASVVSAAMVIPDVREWYLRLRIFECIGHVVGCHDQSVCGRQLWHREIVGEKLECVYYAFTSRGCDVHVLTSVVMHGWAQVISMLPMGCPSPSFSWFLVCNDFHPGGAKDVLLLSTRP